jgi:hypothetical protein
MVDSLYTETRNTHEEDGFGNSAGRFTGAEVEHPRGRNRMERLSDVNLVEDFAMQAIG